MAEKDEKDNLKKVDEFIENSRKEVLHISIENMRFKHKYGVL